MTKEGSSVYYPPDEESAPLKQPSAPHYYGTFEGNPNYPQPAAPGFPHTSEHYRGGTVEGALSVHFEVAIYRCVCA